MTLILDGDKKKCVCKTEQIPLFSYICPQTRFGTVALMSFSVTLPWSYTCTCTYHENMYDLLTLT